MAVKPGGAHGWRVEAQRRPHVKVRQWLLPVEYACEQERRHDFGAIFLSPACTADPRVGHCVSEHEGLPSSREETAPFSSFIYCCERGVLGNFHIIETASGGPLYVS